MRYIDINFLKIRVKRCSKSPKKKARDEIRKDKIKRE